jgi:hypothetical protein
MRSDVQQLWDDIVEQRELVAKLGMDFSEMNELFLHGFSARQIISLLKLRYCYQNGGSDRAIFTRRWEFLKWLVQSNKVEL